MDTAFVVAFSRLTVVLEKLTTDVKQLQIDVGQLQRDVQPARPQQQPQVLQRETDVEWINEFNKILRHCIQDRIPQFKWYTAGTAAAITTQETDESVQKKLREYANKILIDMRTFGRDDDGVIGPVQTKYSELCDKTLFEFREVMAKFMKDRGVLREDFKRIV